MTAQTQMDEIFEELSPIRAGRPPSNALILSNKKLIKIKNFLKKTCSKDIGKLETGHES